MMSPELQSKIYEWQSKCNSGTITQDEMKQAIIELRQGRRQAAEASKTSKSKSTKPARSTADLFAELGGLG